MLSDWPRKKGFPVFVFVALLAVAASGVALGTYAARSEEIPVNRATASEGNADERIDSAAVDRFMVENLRATGIPGAIVAIARNGRILHAAGYGHTADGDAVTPTTPMPIASLTKSITAAAVMVLVEQGNVRLDAPVRDYVAEFELADARGAQITVRHLLNQTSGLSNPALPQPLSVPPTSLTAEVEWLRSAMLVSDPGTQYNYCNDNYNVLALLIERVSGVPYARFLESGLFAPLGMDSSRVFLTGREPMPGVANGHMLMLGVRVARQLPNEFVAGDSGAISSTNDLVLWLVFQSAGGKTVEGDPLLAAESVAVMHGASVSGSGYGFGWLSASLPDGTAYLHHSGRLPNFAAHERLFPETGYAYALVVNGMHPFNAEAASFIAGLTTFVTGGAPTVGPPFVFFGLPFGLIADSALAIVTIVFVSIGIVGAVRSRAWAGRRSGEPSWRVTLRFLPYVVMSAGIVLSPWLLSVVNRGQPVPFGVIFSAWPAIVIVFAAAAGAGAAVVAFRGVGLIRCARRAPSRSAAN